MEKILIIFMILNSGFPGMESDSKKRDAVVSDLENVCLQHSCGQSEQNLTEGSSLLIGDDFFSLAASEMMVWRLLSTQLSEENRVESLTFNEWGMAGSRKSRLKNSFMSVNEIGEPEKSEDAKGRIKRWLIPSVVTVGSGVFIYTLYRVRGK